MEPLSPTHPTFHTYTAIDAQKAINRETSIVQVPTVTAAQQQPPSNVEHNDGAPGDPEVAPASTALRTYGEVQPSPSRASLPPRAPSLSSPQQPTQLYSPTQTEIDSHPIRQRLSVHGDHVAASGWGTRIEEKGSSSLGETRQDDRDTEQGSEREIAGKMTEVKEGDKVAWNWGGGAPGGTASEVVTDGEAKMVSHRGNEVKKKGSPDNPAVHIERPGNDVVKKASELEVEEKGPKHGKDGDDAKKEESKADEKKEETNGEAKTGEKRSADEANKDDAKDDAKSKANGDAAAKEPPKKKGRPAKNGGAGGAAKKETKKKEPKAAATADGKPRRSGRNKS